MAGPADSGDVQPPEEIRLSKEVVSRLDSKYESASDVAGRVWAAIQKDIEPFNRLEVAMFCSEYLGQIAIGAFPNRPEFKQSVVEVAQFIYAGYYARLILNEREESDDVRDERERPEGRDQGSGAIDT